MGGNIVEKNENKNRMKRPKRAQLSSYIYVNDHKLCGSNPSTPVVLKKENRKTKLSLSKKYTDQGKLFKSARLSRTKHEVTLTKIIHFHLKFDHNKY